MRLLYVCLRTRKSGRHYVRIRGGEDEWLNVKDTIVTIKADYISY